MKFPFLSSYPIFLSSPPSRGAWIEMGEQGILAAVSGSPPSRGAWIEMILKQVPFREWNVAPLAGGVD